MLNSDGHIMRSGDQRLEPRACLSTRGCLHHWLPALHPKPPKSRASLSSSPYLKPSNASVFRHHMPYKPSSKHQPIFCLDLISYIVVSMAPVQCKPLLLAELNGRSAPFASFEIFMFRPRIHTYEYMDKTNQKKKQGATFRGLAVSLEKPEHYISVELAMKGQNLAPLEKAVKDLQPGSRFRMSKTRIKGGAKQEYMHTPIKLVVDVHGTTFDPIVTKADQNGGDGKHLAPEPIMTVAQSKALTASQRLDLTALVESVSDARPGGSHREVRDVILVDGSKSPDDDRLVQMKLSFWTGDSLSESDADHLKLLDEVKGTNRAITLFGVQGKKTDKGYQFETSKDFFALESFGPKAKSLVEIYKEVSLVPPEERETLETAFSDRDWSQEKGTEVFTAHLKDLMRHTGVPKIDDASSLWQLNWAEVAWPLQSEETILNKKGTKLWFKTSARDLTGVQSDIWINEESAIALSRAKDKAAFIKAWEDGDQLFPIMASVKIERSSKPVTPDSESSPADPSGADGAKQKYINYVIVEAGDQPLDECPTLATLPLVQMLIEPAHDTASIMPAGLHQINTSPSYAFEITFNTPSRKIVVPCQKVLALIRSDTKSTTELLGEGYKLTTNNVQCLLSSGDSHSAAKTYTVTSVCTVSNLAAYRLDPPRGGSQFALVTITNKNDESFVIESVQLLTEDEAKKTEASLRSIVNLAMHFGLRDRKRRLEWTNDVSPAEARKCSRLGRSPTDAPLPEPSIV